MDLMALKCRSMASLALPSRVWRHAEVGRQAAALQVTRFSLARCSAISAGAHCSGRPSTSEDGCFSEAALSTSSLCGRGKTGGWDWRVCSSGTVSGQLAGEDGGRSGTRLNATVEKVSDVGVTEDKNTQMFGSSEASCDEGSSYLAEESILESEGGRSKEDYKLRAHIFSESDIFFSALKDRNSNRVN